MGNACVPSAKLQLDRALEDGETDPLSKAIEIAESKKAATPKEIEEARKALAQCKLHDEAINHVSDCMKTISSHKLSLQPVLHAIEAAEKSGCQDRRLKASRDFVEKQRCEARDAIKKAVQSKDPDALHDALSKAKKCRLDASELKEVEDMLSQDLEVWFGKMKSMFSPKPADKLPRAKASSEGRSCACDVAQLQWLHTPADADISKTKVPKGELDVFGAKYRASHTVQMHLKAKIFSMSENSFEIVDKSNGKLLFKSQGNALSFHERRMILDADGHPVFLLGQHVLQFNNTQVVYKVDNDGNPKEEVFKIASNFLNTRTSAKDLKNLRGAELHLEGEMDLFGYKGSIWWGDIGEGVPIAKVVSPMAEESAHSDDFVVDVAPGVDLALILAMALAYEGMGNFM